MKLATQISLWMTFLVVAVDCQGGGGGGGGGGAFFGVAGVFIVIFFLPCYLCYQCCAGRPTRSNSTFVGKPISKNDETQILDLQICPSGVWQGYYFQYDQWHGPDQVQLSFDGLLFTVTGSGVDDVGRYTIAGIYSIHSRRMGLTKKYELGTGNPTQNLGHDVIIQLEWNRYNNQFEGKWYVRTEKFKGAGDYKLRIDRTQQQYLSVASIYEKV